MKTFPCGYAEIVEDVIALCGKRIANKGDKVFVLNGYIDAYGEVIVYLNDDHKLNRKHTYININKLKHLD